MTTLQERLSTLSYPMIIVTAATDETRAGCLVGFHTQASIDPLRYLVCLSVKNRTYRVATQASRLAVHLLDEDDAALAELFGGETGDDIDKFARVPWTPGPGGVPLLDVSTRFVGDVIEVIDAGDHTAFLLEPIRSEVTGELDQLSSPEVLDIDPGHDP